MLCSVSTPDCAPGCATGARFLSCQGRALHACSTMHRDQTCSYTHASLSVFALQATQVYGYTWIHTWGQVKGRQSCFWLLCEAAAVHHEFQVLTALRQHLGLKRLITTNCFCVLVLQSLAHFAKSGSKTI